MNDLNHYKSCWMDAKLKAKAAAEEAHKAEQLATAKRDHAQKMAEKANEARREYLNALQRDKE